MRRVLLFVSAGIFGIIVGVAANSLTRKVTPVTKPRGVPVTKIAVQPNAPLSIGRITTATRRVLQIELTNVSDKAIRSFNYTNYKECDTGDQPEGGGVWFDDPRVLKPGQKDVFDVGSDEPISDAKIENCLQNPKEIRFQLVEVRFLDGSTWEAARGDFPGIKSSSP